MIMMKQKMYKEKLRILSIYLFIIELVILFFIKPFVLGFIGDFTSIHLLLFPISFILFLYSFYTLFIYLQNL